MTENLLQKLEEKMMLLVSEIEEAHKEIERLSHENSGLKVERDRHTKKLHDLIALLDVVNHEQAQLQQATTSNVNLPKPVLVTSDIIDTVAG